MPQPKPGEKQRQTRTTLTLNARLDNRIAAYVAAASVGVLSAVVPAEGEVVYTRSNTPMAQGFAGGAITQLDVNNDGTPDFKFTNYSYQTHGLGALYLNIAPDQSGNGIIGVQVPGQEEITAAALEAGVTVGPGANFQSAANGLNMAINALGTSGHASGSWLKVETAYLGLKFIFGGQVHYGWVLVKFNAPGAFLNGSIYGYAYETVPNQSILTGQTSGSVEHAKPISKATGADTLPGGTASLGMLAAGARGLGVWRAA